MELFLFTLLIAALFQLLGGLLPWFALKKYKKHTNKIIIAEVFIMVIISIELIYVGLRISTLALAGVAAGIATVFIINRFVPHTHESKLERLGCLVFIAMCMHELPEGMAFGSSYALNRNFGLLTGLLVSLHNIPEGSIISFPLLLRGKFRPAIFHVCVTQLLYIFGGLVAYVLLIAVSKVTQTILMTFAAGAMLFIALEELKFLKK